MENVLKDFHVSGAEMSFNSLLSKLKFLSKISIGEKIDTNSMSVIKLDITHIAYRTIVNRETRGQTLIFIENIYNEAIEKIQYYSTQKDGFYKDLIKSLIDNVRESYKGISSLKTTYSHDIKFISDLESLKDTTEIKISQRK